MSDDVTAALVGAINEQTKAVLEIQKQVLENSNRTLALSEIYYKNFLRRTYVDPLRNLQIVDSIIELNPALEVYKDDIMAILEANES